VGAGEKEQGIEAGITLKGDRGADVLPLQLGETPLETVADENAKALLEPITIAGATYSEQGIIQGGKVLRGDREVHVSLHELRLIACLKQEKRNYTKDEIARYVWGEAVFSDSQVYCLVYQVRKRLGDHRYIRNRRSQGYELNG
jgi:hypothetical protein